MNETDSNRRRFSRFPCEGQVRFEGWPESCILIDISMHGVLVASPVPIHTGDEVSLTVELDGSTAPIQMTARAVHERNRQVGFECVSIGIESITELRRLTELNLGDESMLMREFDALVGNA